MQIGIGDPHRVIFDLPVEFSYMPGSRVHKAKATAIEKDFYMDTGTSEELLCPLMRLLMKYLMDESVKIIDIAAQALRVSFKNAPYFFILMNPNFVSFENSP